MRYFTKDWFGFCQMENPQPADFARMNEASKKYQAALKGQDIPLPLQERFFTLHDHMIIDGEMSGDTFVLRIEDYDHKKSEIRISFHDTRVKKQDASLVGCDWLYSELYRHYLGYEVHILSPKRKGLDLVELIIQCRDISVK